MQGFTLFSITDPQIYGRRTLGYLSIGQEMPCIKELIRCCVD